MTKTTDIMAWMQRAYVRSLHDPWYKKICLRFKLFHDRHFTRVEGTPGARIVNNEIEAAERRQAARRAELARALGL